MHGEGKKGDPKARRSGWVAKVGGLSPRSWKWKSEGAAGQAGSSQNRHLAIICTSADLSQFTSNN